MGQYVAWWAFSELWAKELCVQFYQTDRIREKGILESYLTFSWTSLSRPRQDWLNITRMWKTYKK